MPLYVFYTMVQKSKNDQKPNQGGGPALSRKSWSVFFSFFFFVRIVEIHMQQW